ncbi:ABC transporter ATP-binding protein, partial [Acidisoma sp. C75]
MTAPSLDVIGMTKRFGALTALDQVSIRVKAGTVFALLGENGAGKSTLVKCIMGFYRADEGEMLLDGREVTTRNPREAQALGIGMVYQHFTLVPSMTVLENLTMGREARIGPIDWRAERAALAAFLETMPFTVPIDRPVASLAAGEKQKAEILKQLWLGSRFLILDEPTSVLTPHEADEMLGLLRGMVEAGRLTVLIITHKFREVRAFADEVAVLRHGKLVGTGTVAELGVDAMARMMVGEREARETAARESIQPGAAILALDAVSARDDAGMPALRSVSLAVRKGEILGIAGVSGNGQTALVEVLAGQRRHEGMVRVHGEPYRATRAEMLRHKLALLPEEPLRNACVGRMTVAENIAFRSFDQPPISAGVRLRHRALQAHAVDLIGRYRVRTAGPGAPIASLSGG